MARTHNTERQQDRCAACGESVPGYNIIHAGSRDEGYRQLCTSCFNAEIANAVRLEGFAHATFDPVGITDCTGLCHEFHFRTRLFGTGVAIDAFELAGGLPAGYPFQIIGDSADDLLVLLGRLIEKMRRALSTKHVIEGNLGVQIADQHVVRGRIEWDENQDGRTPLCIIDGREITWEELGHMLMTYEGWQFKLSIHDKSDEV